MAQRLIICALAALIGCKGEEKAAPAKGAVDFNARCSQLAKACSNNDKHIEKLFDGCTEAAKKQPDAACADKLRALYDCYEKSVCGGSDKVWAFEDLGVLAQRHKTCVAETSALASCGAKP